MAQNIYFLPGKRTPFVKTGGVFASQTPLSLSGEVMKAMRDTARPDLIVWGHVIPSTAYSNGAREAALDAGLDDAIPAYSTQLACSTSMMGAIQAGGMLGKGGLDRIMVGGVEQMSRVPLAFTDDAAARLMALAQTNPAGLPEALSKLSFNAVNLPTKGWSNRISGRTMGDHMEETAKVLSVARERQDEIAYASHINAAKAQGNGFFDDLIIPIGDVTADGLIRADTSLEKLSSLKPVFDPANGSLTAGNSSPLTDGAAGVWVVNDKGREELGNLPAAKLIDFEIGAVNFREDGMLMAPAYAIPRLLARHGLKFEDIDLFEIHEAFAAQVLANVQVASDPQARALYAKTDADLGAFPWERLNPTGGSLALGHPFGATGARILSQTAKQLVSMKPGAKTLVSICADGGQGTVALLERA